MNWGRSKWVKSMVCAALIFGFATTGLRDYAHAEEQVDQQVEQQVDQQVEQPVVQQTEQQVEQPTAAAAVELTSGVKHIPGVKGFKTVINRSELPDAARAFTHITVQTSNAPFAVNDVGVEAYAGLPEPYSQTGYNSGLPSGGAFYVLTILYDSNRHPLAYQEATVTVAGDGATQSTNPVDPAAVKPADPNSYGSDIDPSYNSVGESPFTDITNQYWAFSAIQDLLNRSVISGYPDGKFRPERVVTRAEFAKIMVLAAGLNAVKVSKTSFSDIKPSDWEAPFVEAAKSYLNGYKQANGKLVFKPDAPATREDVAVAIVKLKGYNKTKLPDRTIIQAMFKDYNSISAYAKDYVALAVENNLVSGFPDETFRAQQPVTRAQAASMLWRSYQYGDENKSEDTEEVVEFDDSDVNSGATDDSVDTEQPADNAGQGYSITVKVVDANGNAVNTGLYLKGQSRNYPTSRNDGDSGIYSFSNIPNGTYQVLFHYSGYVLQAPAKITVHSGNVKQVTLKLAVPTFTVTGKVADAEGNPVSDSRISLQTATNTGGYWPATDANGDFKLNDIAPGTYTLLVGDPNQPEASAELEVTDGNVSGLVVQAR